MLTGSWSVRFKHHTQQRTGGARAAYVACCPSACWLFRPMRRIRPVFSAGCGLPCFHWYAGLPVGRGAAVVYDQRARHSGTTGTTRRGSFLSALCHAPFSKVSSLWERVPV
jgi:hypothetical protein